MIAAGSLFLADEFIRNFFRGNSEGILVALCLWAIERHLDGRRRDAFLLGLAAALLRPEVWPFIALYGLTDLIGVARRAAAGARSRSSSVGGLGPGPVVRARVPRLRRLPARRRPRAQAQPGLRRVRRAPVHRGVPPLGVGADAAGLRRRRDRGRRRAVARATALYLAMAAIGTVLMVAVAAMTQAGFAGNLRYVALPAALVCVLAGAGWVGLVRGAAPRWGAARRGRARRARRRRGARSSRGHRRARARPRLTVAEADLYGPVPEAIAKAGGGERS